MQCANEKKGKKEKKKEERRRTWSGARDFKQCIDVWEEEWQNGG